MRKQMKNGSRQDKTENLPGAIMTKTLKMGKNTENFTIGTQLISCPLLRHLLKVGRNQLYDWWIITKSSTRGKLDQNKFNMQAINLKPGFEAVINPTILEKIREENEFIYLHDNLLEISHNLDKSDMYGSPFGEEEDDYESFIRKFEKSFYSLKEYFAEDFEIVYFTYTDEYTANMWKFEGGKLMRSFGWIGDFCSTCEDADDEDEARDEFVDANYADLKQGYPSEELLEGLREALGWFKFNLVYINLKMRYDIIGNIMVMAII